VDGKTPYELWTGKSFDAKTLRVFGSEVSVFIPDQKRKGKWSAKNTYGLFVVMVKPQKVIGFIFPIETLLKLW